MLRPITLVRRRHKLSERLLVVDFGANVLIVDDYATMRHILRGLLQQIGFTNIDDAADGTSALAKLREQPFDLVISDWNMEPMSGLALLKEVRADNALKNLPFIMVTAESKVENVVAAKEAGVSNYIVKPFNADTLKKKIEAAVDAR
jgi:two-component system chemotaxis response regulator CheY